MGFGLLRLDEFIANKRRREVQQTNAKRYDDDGHSNVIGLGLLLLAAVIMAAKELPPQTYVK